MANITVLFRGPGKFPAATPDDPKVRFRVGPCIVVVPETEKALKRYPELFADPSEPLDADATKDALVAAQQRIEALEAEIEASRKSAPAPAAAPAKSAPAKPSAAVDAKSVTSLPYPKRRSLASTLGLTFTGGAPTSDALDEALVALLPDRADEVADAIEALTD